MTTKIKNKLVKWSRNAEKFEKASQIFALIILIFFIPIVLSDIGLKLFPEIIYKVFMGIILGTLVIGICVKVIGAVLSVIKINEQNVHKIRLLYILLSSKDIIWAIITILFVIISLAVGFKFWIFILWLIIPEKVSEKVSNYFKQKLSK